MTNLWDHEEPISEIEELNLDVPSWIEQDISPSQVAAIVQGGCASGAYMPAVTYYDAAKTMTEHGDEVLDYIENSLGELPQPSNSCSWSALAVHYLSAAVELWASEAEQVLNEHFEEHEARIAK